MRLSAKPLLAAALLCACAFSAVAADKPAAKTDPALSAAIAGQWRDPKNVARDVYRHPAQTLTFFGVKPNQTVVEITPGGGWYSEILAPYLQAKGQYVAALAKASDPNSYGGRNNKALTDKFAADKARYGGVKIAEFDAKAPSFGAAGSADAVLTFRNVHNWVDAGNAESYFKAFYAVLKPGGTLGVADHRAKPGTDLEKMKESGYLTEALVIKLATDAGFRLQAKSEINANAKDTTDHPNGVWTLPPTNRHDAADDAKYKAIGESDRMTLRFVKPKA
ncbi:class I SAM-dependent methyltransferase [Luteimonas gilva]|uniref:Class I SAM-dependent methyltransferase n=1 Tax=Luteimonas gilva TaxID=2572684 RepID=A0A4U5JKX0_9GAMM|nr:class I SAM-dependent methyltransferase [Luteimonas gilva]TKR30104.1 class I SAM-dependent methyltransferase [Luteimonas gilva]